MDDDKTHEFWKTVTSVQLITIYHGGGNKCPRYCAIYVSVGIHRGNKWALYFVTWE